MPTEDTTTSSSGLDVNKLLAELEVPFHPTKSGGELPTQPTTESAVRSCLTPTPAPTPIG